MSSRNPRASSSHSNNDLFVCNRYRESNPPKFGDGLYGRNLTQETRDPSSIQTSPSQIGCWFHQCETKTRYLDPQPPPAGSVRRGVRNALTVDSLHCSCRKMPKGFSFTISRLYTLTCAPIPRNSFLLIFHTYTSQKT